MRPRLANGDGAAPPLGLRHYLTHGNRTAAHLADPSLNRFVLNALGPPNGERFAEAWRACRDGLLAEWIEQRPGRRPAGWWWVEAPRWTIDIPPRVRPFIEQAGEQWRLLQPRRRLGGRGIPVYEVLGDMPQFHFGVPVRFVSESDVGILGGPPYGGGFPCDAIDPRDPPRYEAEASYLERHGLLGPRERRRLPEDAFDETVIVARPDEIGGGPSDFAEDAAEGESS
jgi:hypothetical protein